MARYHIAIIRPDGYLHSECFREVAETLRSALRSLGHQVEIGDNTVDALAQNIVLGAHLLTEAEAQSLPLSTIVYNLEQLGNASLPSWYMGLASRVKIWDYSPLNLERWKQMPCLQQSTLVEIGFAPELRRIPAAPFQDIDVLFYGSLNERRNVILRQIQAAGLKLHVAFGVYGPERDALIARAKVVLNVHAYDAEVFEIVRVSYLLANGKAVISETASDIGPLENAVIACPYETLAAETVALVADDSRRHTLETTGAAIFAQRDQAAILRAVLAPPDLPYPRRLNLGSGKDWREDCLNIDINAYWQPDAVLDISEQLPDEFELSTARFGTIRIRSGCFDEILANDVLEHIPNLTKAVGNALRLLQTGGRFHVQVPYDLSWGAWQDPTHIRAFNERSWLYYTDWFWYLGWTEARFTVDKMEFVLSPTGERLQATSAGEDLIRSPRAVDMMRVTLRKQPLTADEKLYVQNYLKRPERVAPALKLDSNSRSAQLQPQPEPLLTPLATKDPSGAASLSAARRLYLDMVQRCVINTIYEDPNGDRWSPHTYDQERRQFGRDWPAQAHSMIGNARMTNLRGIAEYVLENRIPGDFIETGVWRGGACILMRAVLKAYGDTMRRVWVADSFCGLPAPDPGLAGDSGDVHHTYTELVVSSEQVRSNFAKYDLLDEQVQFLEGWFSDTLPSAPIEQLALLRLDGDMYASTMDALNALYDKVVPGGFIIVDDFGAVAGCKQAIFEFRASRGITSVIHDIDGYGAFWQKQPAPQHELAADLIHALSLA